MKGVKVFLPHYSVQKRALRDMSLSMCNGHIRTTHMTVGGLNDMKYGNELNMDPIHIANAIKWVLGNEVNIPIIGIEKL